MPDEKLVEMKPQVYKDPRPAEHFARFYRRPAERRPDLMYEVVRMLLTPYLLFLHRARCIDSDKVPVDGPAIVAPNHFSFLDHFFIAVYLRRKVHFMAKSQLFQRPMQFVYTHGGVFPVRRGHRDEQSMATAKAILGRGDLIVMYAEGGRSRTGELGEAKPGVGRLALETGAPVVPSAIVGTEKARNWKRLQFPKVTIQYGDPVRFEQVDNPTREQAQAAADVVFAEIKKLHTGLREADGRKKAIAAARSARRAAGQAAEAATRTPGPAR
jgi:1-acyl-sn-glycerol-3-phosphate acyltransferase